MSESYTTPDSLQDASRGSTHPRNSSTSRRLNGSRPGETNYLIPISNGLLTAEHRKRMGVAVWEFAWLVDRTTVEREGSGVVLGGKPITYSEIARQLGLSNRTVQENCHALRDQGYIRMERTPCGIKFLVAKSKKFAASRTEETFRSDKARPEESFRSDRKKASDPTGRNLPLHIDNTVDITQDKNSSSPSEAKGASDQGKILAGLLKSRILENNPKAKVTDAQLRKWALEADLMMRRDERTEAEIRKLIEWSQRDSFWKSNILSMGMLRKQFDRLVLKMKGESDHASNATRGNGSGNHSPADLSRFASVGRKAAPAVERNP